MVGRQGEPRRAGPRRAAASQAQGALPAAAAAVQPAAAQPAAAAAPQQPTLAEQIGQRERELQDLRRAQEQQEQRAAAAAPPARAAVAAATTDTTNALAAAPMQVAPQAAVQQMLQTAGNQQHNAHAAHNLFARQAALCAEGALRPSAALLQDLAGLMRGLPHPELQAVCLCAHLRAAAGVWHRNSITLPVARRIAAGSADLTVIGKEDLAYGLVVELAAARAIAGLVQAGLVPVTEARRAAHCARLERETVCRYQ